MDGTVQGTNQYYRQLLAAEDIGARFHEFCKSVGATIQHGEVIVTTRAQLEAIDGWWKKETGHV